MEERRMARLEREGGLFDPWVRCDLDDWTAEDILANALLDPNPLSAEQEFFAGPMASASSYIPAPVPAYASMKKKRASWKDSWLSLL